jgi:hypothetical protein
MNKKQRTQRKFDHRWQRDGGKLNSSMTGTKCTTGYRSNVGAPRFTSKLEQYQQECLKIPPKI